VGGDQMHGEVMGGAMEGMVNTTVVPSRILDVCLRRHQFTNRVVREWTLPERHVIGSHTCWLEAASVRSDSILKEGKELFLFVVGFKSCGRVLINKNALGAGADMRTSSNGFGSCGRVLITKNALGAGQTCEHLLMGSNHAAGS
jgi:hypothetical protein